MNTKLTTPAQVALLREGSIITQFPINCADGPADVLDELRTKHLNTYEIRSFNNQTNMFLLVSANFRNLVSAAPADIQRLYISAGDLITDKLWWVNS